MAESTLSITTSVIQREVGRFLGFNRDPSTWTSSETQDVSDCIDAGARQFYHPPILPGERVAHRWSFLRQLLTIITVAATNEYTLTDLFGGFVGTLAFAAADNVPLQALQETSIANILAKRQLDTASAISGPPQLYAVYPKTSTGTTGQRFQIALWPTPDKAYSLTGEYFIDPYSVAGASYALGGQPHGETLLESCLAMADLKLNGAKGAHFTQFMERLQASVSFDRGTTGPDHFGYNADRSEPSDYRDWRHRLGGNLSTYNGLTWQP